MDEISGLSMPPKSSESLKSKERKSNNQDLNIGGKTEKEGRSGEGLDVDLNLESPLVEHLENVASRGKDDDETGHIEGNVEFNRYNEGWNLSQVRGMSRDKKNQIEALLRKI